MFDPILTQILAIARDAWSFMAGLLIVVALLGGMYYVLKGRPAWPSAAVV